MNVKRITYILPFALPALLFFACSQEETALNGRMSDGDDIIFHTSMPGVETRSYDNIQMGQLEGGFTVAAHNLDIDLPVKSKLPLYFEQVLVTRTEGMGNAFRGEGCKWPDNRDDRKGRLRFYAFYPSIEKMKEKSGFNEGMADVEPGKEYFLLHDISERKDTGNFFSYRIGNFKVNRDILRHMDFVAATALGNKTDNLYSGVTLEFSHRLSRIDFKAWSDNPSYDIEIAGVRIGGAIVSTTYNMEGNWIYGSATEKKPVEYIFREGDILVKLDGKSYNTKETAASIMGNGGWAMIIPGNQNNNVGKYTAWNGTGTAGVYFSVLMRVTDRNPVDNYMVLYPYIDGSTITGNFTAQNKNVVYLVVEPNSGQVIQRVYKKFKTKQYFTDATLKNPYTVEAGYEIREYGWAAIKHGPSASATKWWDPGTTYSYVFNYTNGLGVHAPDDDAPGKPIITSLSVGVSEEEGIWNMVKDYDDVVLEEDKDFKYEQE